MDVGIENLVPTKLWCDDQATMHIASNPVFHEHTEHIEINCHFIREKIQLWLISTGYVKTREQLEDILMQQWDHDGLSKGLSKLGMSFAVV